MVADWTSLWCLAAPRPVSIASPVLMGCATRNMKRLTPRYRRWLRHRQRYVAGQHSAVATTVHTVWTEGVLLRARVSNLRKAVPENFCLDTNRDEMLAFFWNFRRQMSLPIRGRVLPTKYGSRVPRIGSYYDFAAIKKITPAAALVFASELDRIPPAFRATNVCR